MRETKIISISAGGGFSMAISSDGILYSWGVCARGRLGKGDLRFDRTNHNEGEEEGEESAVSRMRRRKRGLRGWSKMTTSKPKVARYQFFPKKVSIPPPYLPIHVSCGDAHTLLIVSPPFSDIDRSRGTTDLDKLYLMGWGSNVNGQVGVGVSKEGYLNDVLYPEFIQPFSPESDEPTSLLPPPSALLLSSINNSSYSPIACGTNHSLAIDNNGSVWTWGAVSPSSPSPGLMSSCLGRSGLLAASQSLIRDEELLKKVI